MSRTMTPGEKWMANDLADRAIRRKQEKVDVRVSGGGTVYLVHPLTPAAKEWIQEHVGEPGEETHYLGDALAVEHRYIRDLVAGMQADGLTVR